jgi:polyhydroxyalkanoate synthase
MSPGLAKFAKPTDAGPDGAPKPDFERMAYNMARLVEQGGKALAASLKPPEKGEQASDLSNELQDAIRSIGKVSEHWLSDPARTRRGAIGAGSEFSRPVVEYDAAAGGRNRDARRSA